MFVSAVAPAGEKSKKDSDLDVRKSSIDRVRVLECGILQSGFLKTFKYPVILMNMGGIYVPSFCVCNKELFFNGRVKSNSGDISESSSNHDNTKSFIYVQCVKGVCLRDERVLRSCPDDDSAWWAIAKKVASILMIICHCTNSIRYVFILKSVSDKEEMLVFSLINYFILNSFFYVLTLNSYSCLKHFTPFLSAVSKYEKKYGFKCKFKTYSRNNFILFCFVVVFQFVQAAVLMYGILIFSDSVSPQLWPLTHVNGVLRFFGALIVGVGVFFAGCNLYGAHFFRSIVTNMLHGEFQRMAADLSAILSNTNDSSCVELLFDQILDKFKVVCDLMDKGYNIIKHTIAAGFIFGIPTLCLVLYGVIKRSIQLEHYLILSVNTITAMVILVHTMWTLAGLKSQIKSVCNAVYLSDWSTFSSQLLHKILLFTNMFCTQQFGLTVYGMFVVDWSTILAVGGIMAAYGVFVTQFELGTAVHICHFGNLTLTESLA